MERIENICITYDKSFGEVYDLINFENRKLHYREYGFFKGLFKCDNFLKDKSFIIVERYYKLK